jgi:hypothetical protein
MGSLARNVEIVVKCQPGLADIATTICETQCGHCMLAV